MTTGQVQQAAAGQPLPHSQKTRPPDRTQGRPYDRGWKKAKGTTRKAKAWISSHTRTVILLTLSFVGCFAVLIGLKLAKDYQDTLFAAEKTVESTAGTVSMQFRAHLLSAETLMDYAGLIHRYGSGRLLPVDEAQTTNLSQRLEASPLLQQITIIDGKGLPVFSSQQSGAPIENQMDSVPFKFHKSEPGNALFIFGGADFQISKRLSNNEGTFIGIASITFKQNYLEELAASSSLDPSVDLALSGRNGVILASSMPTDLRGGHIANLIGMPWPLPAPSQGALTAYTKNIEETRFIVGAREISGTPFTFYAAQTVQNALSSWYTSLTLYLLMILAPALFGAGVCGILIRQAGQRNAAIKARHFSEARLNLAIDGARCGIWDWDLEKEIVHWSPSMYALLGRIDGAPQISFSDIRQLMHPEDRGLLTEIIEGATQNDAGYDQTFRLRHAHGEWIWVHAKGQRQQQSMVPDVKTDQEEVGTQPPLPRLVGLAIDISLQKASEARVLEMEARLRDAIENISESFALWDDRNELILCNQKFIEFFKIDPRRAREGVPYKEVIASAEFPLEIISENDQGAIGNIPLGADDDDNISELQHIDGRWIHINTRKTSTNGRVSIGIDVTSLKEQEDELLLGEEELKQHVQKLEESQLRLRHEATDRAELAVKYASEKARAEEASRSKTEFLANMSHELRTPLNAIMGFAQIMSDGMFGTLGDQKYESYTRDILDSAQYLLTLINDILDMSKIETGKLDLEPENIALGHIMESCLRIVEPRAFEAGLRINYEPDTLLSVYADKRALKQVLLNLLSNAIKFTPRGGEITVEADIGPNYATISIEDNGIGIATKDLPRIGKPFEQIEKQNTKTYKGSGLGLALSKSLVELQGGALTLESELGIGTKVCFTLLRNKPREGTIETEALEQTVSV